MPGPSIAFEASGSKPDRSFESEAFSDKNERLSDLT